MDLDEKRFFVHNKEAEIRSANLPFEVRKPGARGRVITLMISIIVIQEEIKPRYFGPILKEFVNDFLNIEDVQAGFSIHNKKEYSEQKAKEIEELFHSFYQDLPEETVIIDKNVRLMVYGLEGAGKTSLIQFMKEHKSQNHTLNIIAKKLLFNNLTLTSWDLPVKRMFGVIWNHYAKIQDGFIFMIDASKPECFQEARAELFKVSRHIVKEGLPLLILFNKADIAHHSLEALINIFKFSELKLKKYKIFLISIDKGFNIFESFEWFANRILHEILKTWE